MYGKKRYWTRTYKAGYRRAWGEVRLVIGCLTLGFVLGVICAENIGVQLWYPKNASAFLPRLFRDGAFSLDA
jgi:hypothetical protein